MLPAGVLQPAFRILFVYMQVTTTLIEKFFADQCTAAEAEAVANYLREHPEFADRYLEDYWCDRGDEQDIPAGYTNEMRNYITAFLPGPYKRSTIRYWAAALLFIMFGAGLIHWWEKNEAREVPALAAVPGKQLAVPVWETQFNVTKKIREFQLRDGSKVRLYPNAKIKYRSSFSSQNYRDIYLDGMAEFDVAHDKLHPFVVHSKRFSTTALGTSFRVTIAPQSETIRLFHGKVLVKSLYTLKGWNRDMILLPGKEMRYDDHAGCVAVVSFMANKNTIAVRDSADNSSAAKAIVFHHAALRDVFRALTIRYHTSIEYTPSLVSGKYFSGELRATDSLPVLLKVLSGMNDLQVTKKDSIYVLVQNNDNL